MNPRPISRALLAACILAGSLPASSPGQEAQPRHAVRTGKEKGTPREVVTRSGLRYVELARGTGEEARPGSTVEIHYTGWLPNGSAFDSSRHNSQPFRFRIGIDEVIQGWHEGLVGMKVGGRRRLVVPPELGYGKQGAGGVIPPNATLVFEIELLEVK